MAHEFQRKLLKYFVETVDGNATGDTSTPRENQERVSEYPASLVVAMLSAIKRPMISDGAIRIGEVHFAGPVPEKGDYPTELEGKWGVDGMWIDPKLLIAGRKEEMEYMTKMGVFEVVDEKKVLRQRLQTSHVDMSGQDEGREMPFEIGLSGDQKGEGQRRTTWTRRRIFTHAAVGRVEDA